MLDLWKLLAEPKHESLIAEAAAARPHNAAAVKRLRKYWSAELVRLALQLAEARRKGKAKFGKRAETMWADPQGMEMASSALAADYKALEFERLGAHRRVADLCCGIGGDAMFLALRSTVHAVDRDPVRAWMAGRNASCKAEVGTVEAHEPDSPWHIDPSRRTESGGKRLWRLEEMQPGIGVVRRHFERRTSTWAAIKLSPGARFEEVERHLPGCRIHVISENGRLTQAVAWVGPDAAHPSRGAALIRGTADDPPGSRRHELLVGEPSGQRTDEHTMPHRYLFEPDDSVERADILHVLCTLVGAPPLHPRVGLITADALIDSPWLTPFEVLDRTPWNERRVAAMLRERGAGIVEVKTRGRVVNPDELQPALSGKGDTPLVLFVLRFGSSIEAIIARRITR